MRSEHVAQRLKLRDLHVLQTVAECGSMMKAAQRLAMSQPAVSKAVADIEHTIRAPVFDRGPRGVELTVYGSVLLRRGRAILDELKQGIAEMDFLADPTAGDVRIGSTEPMTALVSAIIERMSRIYPRVVFHVTVGGTNLLHRHLREREVDLAVTRMLGAEPDQEFEREVLFADPLVIVAGKRHPLTRRRIITLRDLSNEQWILGPADGFLAPLIDEAFREAGVESPKGNVISTSTYLRNNLLSAGRFLTILPEAMLKFPRPHATLTALAVPLPSSRRPVGILKLRQRHLNPVADLLMGVAREVAKKLPRGDEDP